MDGCKELVDIFERMIGAGVNVNILDDDKNSPLISVCNSYVLTEKNDKGLERKQYLLEVIELLLKKGAKVNILSGEGTWSPLMCAAGYDEHELAELLLKYGAKKDFADTSGNTAFVYAKQNKFNDIAQTVNPASTLLIKDRLFAAGEIALKVIIITSVFFSMDVISRIMLSFNFIYPVLLVSSILLSYFLTFYIIIVLFGINEFFEMIKGSFNFVSSILFLIFGIPIVFPVVVAILQYLTGFLPDGLLAFFNLSTRILTTPSSGVTILILYLLFLGIMMAGTIFYGRIRGIFGKAARIYMQYED
jgi:hypothetical protein